VALASVIASSCSVDRLILDYSNVFSDQAKVFAPENITTVPISPADMDFIQSNLVIRPGSN
jgi:hypothetical protein